MITLNAGFTYAFLLFIVVFIIYVIKVSKNSDFNFSLLDLISNPDGSAYLTRILQFAAGATGTWVVIKLTLAGTLSYDMFGIYLAAMGISEGFTKWIQAKNSVPK